MDCRDIDVVADGSGSQDEKIASLRFLKQIEVNQTLTSLYLIVEASRWQRAKQQGLEMQRNIGR